MDERVLKPIGIIHSPFKSKVGVPIQPRYANPEIRGRVEVFPEYEAGLADLNGFSHIVLVYLFHKSSGYSLRTKPFLEDVERGVFATRAPRRPNPIGISVVPLERVEKNVLHVTHLDVLDGTPLLDIKPYVPQFDEYRSVRIGWLKGRAERRGRKHSDDRFARQDS